MYSRQKKGKVYFFLFLVGLFFTLLFSYYLFFSFIFFFIGVEDPFSFFAPRWIIFFVPLVFFWNKKEVKKVVDYYIIKQQGKRK